MDNGAAGSFWENFGLLIPIIAIVIFSFLRRRRGGGAKTNLEVTVGLLADTKHNLKTIETIASNRH